jgi:murein DD-endopeptidase MepM/ murein hydrolase activator NlpD
MICRVAILFALSLALAQRSDQLFGHWKVNAVTTASPVTAMSGSDAARLVGHLNYPFGGAKGTGVRSAGAQSHAGWDLDANPGISAFAVTDGYVVHTGVMRG